MTPRALLAALCAATPLVLAAGPVPTPSPLADQTLQNAAQIALPAIVTVVQNVSGAVADTSDGQVHGPFVSAFAGTGFFISSDGYLVTAAHVAAPSPDEIKGELVDFYIDESLKCDPATTADHCQSVQDAHHDEYMNRVTAVNPSVDLRVLTQDMSPADDGVTAKLISSSPTLDQDNAVLKIEGKDEPVALLGDSTKAAVATGIAVIGYPVSGQTKGPTLVPTLTSGQVTSTRRGNPGSFSGIGGNADLLQIDARTEHGNSGGPAVQGDGGVIGIVSFGDTRNHNYLIASNDVVNDVGKTPAKNSLGPIDTLYRNGLDAYKKGDYPTAKSNFDHCAAMNPVQIYCKDLALQATNGGPAQSSPATLGEVALGWAERGLWALIGGLLGAGLVFLLARRRLRPAGSPVSTATYGPAQPALAGYGGYTHQQGVQHRPAEAPRPAPPAFTPVAPRYPASPSAPLGYPGYPASYGAAPMNSGYTGYAVPQAPPSFMTPPAAPSPPYPYPPQTHPPNLGYGDRSAPLPPSMASPPAAAASEQGADPVMPI
ncbi:MAG: trypsin-like peptidase domain-containing protein [Candidatus Dormibacteria bacterium]